MFAGEHTGKFHLTDLLLQTGQHLAHFFQDLLVFSLFTKLDQDLSVLQTAGNRIIILNQFLQKSSLFQDLLGLFVIIPEFRLGNLGLEFCNPFPFAVNVKDTPSAR